MQFDLKTNFLEKDTYPRLCIDSKQKTKRYVEDEEGKPKLQINAQNCLHCKVLGITYMYY